MKDFEKTIREKGKCCITEKPLKDSKYINIVQLHMPVTWEHPKWGNFLSGHENLAVAYVHDDAIQKGKLIGKVKFAVEFDGDEIIYHPVRACRICGCTDDDCSQCIEKTGAPCHWVGPDLCSACAPPDESANKKNKKFKKFLDGLNDGGIIKNPRNN